MSTRGVLVALILTATAAFVLGVSLERHETHTEAATETPAQRAAEGNGGEAGTTHDEAGVSSESTEHGGSTEHSEGTEHNDSTKTTAATPTPPTTTAPPASETPAHSEASERLLGVDAESTGLLVAAVAVSLLLAAGVWWLGASPLALGVVALAMAAFAALDIREVVHQADESRTGLMLLAALVAVLHLTAAALAARAATHPVASAHARVPREHAEQ
jgi:hypothetical protein